MDNKNQMNNIHTITSTNEKIKLTTPPRMRVSISSENKKLNSSGSKKRVSDRFIPSSIGKNIFISEFDSETKSTNNNPSQFKSLTTKKSDINYQKMLHSEIVEESTPKFNENSGNKNVLDLFKINRNLKFHSEVKKIRKMKINKENSVDSQENLNYKESVKKIKIEKSYKSFFFENVTDNFYLNNVDIFDINKVSIGTKTDLQIFDGNSEQYQDSFIRYQTDSPFEIYSVKFVNNNRLVFSDANFTLKIKDLTKEIEILKFDVIRRKFLTIEIHKHNENILFLGSDNSNVDLYDLRVKNKVKNLYKHDNPNEVCKIRYSDKNNFVISGGNDNKILIYDLRKNQKIETFKHKAAVKGLAINEDENLIISGGGTFDKTLKLWDMKKLQLISEQVTDSQITNIEFLTNNHFAVSSGYVANNIILYNLDLDSNNKVESISQFTNTQNSNSILRDSFSTFNKISIFEKHAKRILYMAKSRCNNYLTSCSTDGNLKIWKMSKYIQNKQFAADSIFCGIR